jgi:UDP-4-amino-4,6-dideoxy-N-acetyl-beta-L-altrosamine N-acetyltransferase
MSLFHKSFEDAQFTYKNFIHLSDNELIEVLSWRNSDFTRKWMKNKNIISEESHLLYCKHLNEQNTIAHWRLSYNQRYIGVISINEYFIGKNSCEWGFYLNEQRLPEDSLVIFYASLRYFFEILSLSTLHGSVKMNNKAAILLNKYFKFTEVERKIIEGESYSILKLDQRTWMESKITLEQLISGFYHFYTSNK